jgi:hypothetical protein
MKLQSHLGLWVVYDGRRGGGVVEADLVSAALKEGEDLSGEDIERLIEFTEETSADGIFDARVERGWCARYSAPGFMDRTDWCGPFDSREEAEEEATRMHGAE